MDELTTLIETLKNNCDSYKIQCEEAESKYEAIYSKLQQQKCQNSEIHRELACIEELTLKNAAQQTEIKGVRQQVMILEEQIRKMQILIDNSAKEKAQLKQEITELNFQAVYNF